MQRSAPAGLCATRSLVEKAKFVMMRTLVTIAIAIVLATTSAPAATPVKAFRHLAWQVDVGITHRTERDRSTALPSHDDAGNASGQHVAGGTDVQAVRSFASNRVSVDIVGATDNDGLAAIVGETGDRAVEPIRLDIQGDASVVVPPADQARINAEEVLIAELCSRTLMTNHPLVAGEKWTISKDALKYKASVTYRIKGYSDDAIALVDYDSTLRGAVNGAVTQHTYGTFHYDARRTVPVDVRLTRVTQTGQLGALSTTEESFEYKLIEDTLPKS